MLNGLDLFSGIGGLSIALSDWVRPAAYCEIDRYAQSVLLSRMCGGELPVGPIWDDIAGLNGHLLPHIDIIYGGFPCQDISVAGAGKGLAGERSGLFFEIIRLVKETGAPWVFLENVPAIRTRGLKEVVGAFTDLGYDCRWTRVSAAEVGAPHLRERWFLLANASGKSVGDQQGRRSRPSGKDQAKSGDNGSKKHVADPRCSRLEGQRKEPSGASKELQDSSYTCWWASEPNVGRVANGIPTRVDRIKGLGNAVVPLQAKVAFERLIGLER